jgi:D-3-phosphoglycerate dehydrogenase / 2-oxoglutarate reductase
MKRVVSLVGSRNSDFVPLNERASLYAATIGLEYIWLPMQPLDWKVAIEALRDADAAIIDMEPYNESVFREIGSKARILVRFGVGYDAVDLEAATRHGIAIARTTGANASGVAEMALTLILALKRHLLAHHASLGEGRWRKQMGAEISGSTVGIVGFGEVGRKLARNLAGFECTILAHDPYPDRQAAERLGVQLTTLEALFESSDAISLHLAYNTSTHHIVNTELISRMKPTAVIVNTSRGGVIDDQALYDALKSGRIAGAGLDVYAAEPATLENPLLGLENVIHTPHVASFTHRSFWCTYEMALRTIADFFAGKPCGNILNKDYASAKR